MLPVARLLVCSPGRTGNPVDCPVLADTRKFIQPSSMRCSRTPYWREPLAARRVGVEPVAAFSPQRPAAGFRFVGWSASYAYDSARHPDGCCLLRTGTGMLVAYSGNMYLSGGFT